MLLFSKDAFFPSVNRVLEEEELERAQMSETNKWRSSLNAYKAEVSRSVIMRLGIRTEEKNYINYHLLQTSREGAMELKYGYCYWRCMM